MRLAVLLAPVILACATGKPPRGPGGPPAIAVWSPPEGCALRSRDSSDEVREESSAVMIKEDDELKKIVECSDKKREPFPFDDEWLASFTFVSKGGSFKPLALRDDGETLTLEVEQHYYCGGTPPPTVVDRILYRVPATKRKLVANVKPANDPPCPPGIP